MTVRSEADQGGPLGGGFRDAPAWYAGLAGSPVFAALASEKPFLPHAEARRLRSVIEAAVGDVFGVPRDRLATPSRGKAPVALARQAAMYLAHVSCRLSLTDVGYVFARDRTTVAHACHVIEDRRDDPVFDRALELLEWIVPTLAGHSSRSVHGDN
jgi:hypothetical protein